MKKISKVLSLILIMAMLCLLCAGCGFGGKDNAETTENTENTENNEENTEKKDVKVGLEQNVYEIPDYTNVGDDVKVLRLSVTMGAGDYGVSATGAMFKTFVDTIEQVSGGKMVAKVFPSNQLAGSTDEIVNGLKSGAFEMAEVAQANWGDYTTAFTRMNVPFLYSSNAVAYDIMSGEVGDTMRAQLLADTGIRSTGFMYLGMRTLSNSKKEIHTPADLKGLKLRVQNDPTQLAMFKELGASTMTVSFSELFTALQQKLCDAQDNPIVTFVSKKFYEVQDYLTLLNHLPNISMFIINDDYYQSLSAEEQGWVDQASQAATEACYAKMQETEGILLDQLRDYGITVTELTDDEYQQFAGGVSETWQLCKDTIGEDEWNKLMDAVKAAEARN